MKTTVEEAVRQYLSLTLAATRCEHDHHAAEEATTAITAAALRDASNRCEAYARALIAHFGVHAAYAIFRQANTMREQILAA